MMPYMKSRTHSGMRKITNSKKLNQIPDHAKKIIEVDRKKLLSAGSKLGIYY